MLLWDLVDRIVTDRTGGTIVLKTTFAGMAQGLFETKAMEKQFAVGGANRVPWKPTKGIRLDERGSILVRRQMDTHLSSNLNRDDPTIAVPFRVLADGRFAQRLKKLPVTLGDHLRKRRLDLGLLQREVAQELGVDEDSVCHWEVGHSHPKPYLIPRVIAFLGYAPWAAPATFGEWLIMVRRANGLSRKRFAKRLGVDQSTVSRWESGRGCPGSRLLARLKGAFTLDKNEQ